MSLTKVQPVEKVDKFLSGGPESSDSSDEEDASAHAKLLADMQTITKKDR